MRSAVKGIDDDNVKKDLNNKWPFEDDEDVAARTEVTGYRWESR